MLWFFAVAAAIAAGLWGAVRLEKGLGSTPVPEQRARICQGSATTPDLPETADRLAPAGCHGMPGDARPRMMRTAMAAKD
jgi:hypothetical protein